MINIVFFGTPDIGLKSLEYLNNSDKINVLAVVTQPDRPSGRGHKITMSPIVKSSELIFVVFPSRITVALGEESFFRFSSEVIALTSSTVPINALSKMTINIIITSGQSPVLVKLNTSLFLMHFTVS